MEKRQVKAGKSALTGVIDIGSGFLQLKIAYKDEDQKVRLLESVTKTLAIGRETFSQGRISPEMVQELSQNLIGFRKLLREYRVRKVRVVATGAIREAQNREYVMDQIRANTGFTIEIMNGPQERLLTQMAIRKALPSGALKNGGMLLVNIGSGGVQIAGYAGKKGLQYSQNVRMGALRIRQILASLETQTVEYTKILEEYIDQHIQEVMEQIAKEFQELVITGEEVNSLYKICSGEEAEQVPVMSSQALKALYEKLLYMSGQQIADEYGLSYERAEMLLPTIMIIRAFVRASGAKEVLCPQVGLSNGILYEMNREKDDLEMEEEILRYTRYISKHYYDAEAHVEEVVKNALLIFDHLGRRQNLSRRHRLLLEMGAILHDIGKSINLVNHAECGAALLSHMDLLGISEEEQKQLTVLVRYHESGEPRAFDEQYQALNKRNRMVVSKLLAVLQLANALDFSHKQKLIDITAKQEGENFVLRAYAKENSMLEQWVFQQSGGLFREVFSLEPKLGIRAKRMGN